MSFATAMKSAAVQAASVAVLFALLVAAPLPEDFFRDYGAAAGPIAWLGCAALTGRLLSLRPAIVLGGAVAGGAAGGALTVAGAHSAGMVAAVLVFGLTCGALAARSPGRSRTTLAP